MLHFDQRFDFMQSEIQKQERASSNSTQPSKVLRQNTRRNDRAAETDKRESFLPFVDEINAHDFDRIVTRRAMDLNEDLFAANHTLGGRRISEVEPDQTGLPVVPMTFSLEILAELASKLCPDLCLVGVERVRLAKWIDYHQPKSSIQAELKIKSRQADGGYVKATGKIFHFATGSEPNLERPTSTFTLHLRDKYSSPRKAGEADLGKEIGNCSTKQLYDHLFHGPQMQGVSAIKGVFEDGVVASVKILSRNELFTSQSNPAFIVDPVMLDSAMQPMCAWHTLQDNPNGRVLLPIGVDEIEFFGPIPKVATELTSITTRTRESTRQFSHDVELVDAAGNLFCRMKGCHYWRFYVPSGIGNFQGPKNEYSFASIVDPLPTNSRFGEPNFSTIKLDVPTDLDNDTLQLAAAHSVLSNQEMAEYRKLRPNEERTQWLFARIAAKEALRKFHAAKDSKRFFLADIEIQGMTLNNFSASYRDSSARIKLAEVSVAQTGMTFVAMAGPERVDLSIKRVSPAEPSLAEQPSGISAETHELNDLMLAISSSSNR